MKKTILLAAVFTLLTPSVFAERAAVQATTKSNVQTANTVRISTRPEILGLWGMVIPENKKCIEYYNFRGNNELVVNSFKEWSTGIYEYQPAPDNTQTKLPALIIQIKHDNNQADCSGRREDQSGELSQFYVQWKNSNTINFCTSEQGDKCLATLHRVLP